MRFKVDENLPKEIAEDLRSLGHDADTVGSEALAGRADEIILERAHTDRRIILTLHKGVANVIRYPAERHSGIVLFRPESSGRGAVLAFVRTRIAALLSLELEGHVTVVTRFAIRRR
jgi:predicted nuclease of predicted toxin-antitoxin system